ncbi:MAG: MBL fold metallo-hydrolase [Prolixibacteraceae bacterium]|jgi:7,8-dihydropterin-6-yl-methyl-4-(beta-D-ribofuranosyl)aminobenzene 5'-phosphate synthase|nr:MBL fold metallo-hydrolase [Prolixibacteraceae bacterium]
MKISILTDNYPGGNTRAEHGLSYFIEHDGTKILFDTGQSNLFLQNASKMGIDAVNPDAIVLSHGHFDHGDGLDSLSGGKLICHPGCFVKRYRSRDQSYIGLKNTKEQLNKKFELITTAGPYPISEKIIFLGEISRISDFESKETPFSFKDGSLDFVVDDSAIALLLNEGLFVITGCGHSGIENTLEHAKKVTRENRLLGIMGGFHLKKNDEQTKETISYLKKNKVKHIYPSHCTELPALVAFYNSFTISLLKTGRVLNF